MNSAPDPSALLEDLQKLSDLLAAQKDALEGDQADHLAALLPLIEACSNRLAAHLRQTSSADPTTLSAQTQALARRLLGAAVENANGYRGRISALEREQRRLQSASRYARLQRQAAKPNAGRLTLKG